MQTPPCSAPPVPVPRRRCRGPPGACSDRLKTPGRFTGPGAAAPGLQLRMPASPDASLSARVPSPGAGRAARHACPRARACPRGWADRLGPTRRMRVAAQASLAPDPRRARCTGRDPRAAPPARPCMGAGSGHIGFIHGHAHTWRGRVGDSPVTVTTHDAGWLREERGMARPGSCFLVFFFFFNKKRKLLGGEWGAECGAGAARGPLGEPLSAGLRGRGGRSRRFPILVEKHREHATCETLDRRGDTRRARLEPLPLPGGPRGWKGRVGEHWTRNTNTGPEGVASGQKEELVFGGHGAGRASPGCWRSGAEAGRGLCCWWVAVPAPYASGSYS